MSCLTPKVASLSVLYEDLRVEMTGIAARSLPVLEYVLEPRERIPRQTRTYRQFPTVVFHAAVNRHRNGVCGDTSVASSESTVDGFCQALRPDSREYATETLASAIAFFAHKEPLIKKIRNDIGGHFGQKTARSALSFIAAESIGKMEIVTKGDDSDIRLNFATEIAASALLKHLPGQNIDAFKDLLTDTIIGGYRHATRSVQIICGIWLWQRFGH